MPQPTVEEALTNLLEEAAGGRLPAAVYDRTLHPPVDEWWEAWWIENYSWDGLLAQPCPATHSAINGRGPPNLQSYWRSSLDGSGLRSEEEMGGELVHDPEGRTWHIAHVPLFWADGTPAKASWSEEEWSELTAVLDRFLAHSLGGGEAYLVFLDGVVADYLMLPQSTLNALLYQSYIGKWLSIEKITSCSGIRSSMICGQLNITDCTVDGDIVLQDNTFLSNVYLGSLVIKGSLFLYKSTIHGSCNIDEMTTGGTLEAGQAKFLGRVGIRNGKFSGGCQLVHAEFHEEADFGGSRFCGRALFHEARFGKRFSFENVGFEDAAFFLSNSWPNPEAGEGPAYERAFYNTRFQGTAAFRGTGFGRFAAFDGAVFGGSVQIDQASESDARKQMRAELSLARRSVSPAARIEALHGGCHALRYALERTSDKKGEWLLHRFELMARRYQPGIPRWERIVSSLYDLLSDYGASIGRPMATLFATLIVCGLVYGAAGALASGALSNGFPITGQDMSRLLLEGFTLSAERTFPFGLWKVERSEFLSILIGDPGTLRSFLIRSLGTAQSIFSATLLFLTALAIRKRFQIG